MQDIMNPANPASPLSPANPFNIFNNDETETNGDKSHEESQSNADNTPQEIRTNDNTFFNATKAKGYMSLLLQIIAIILILIIYKKFLHDICR